jgi:hypothetical protein
MLEIALHRLVHFLNRTTMEYIQLQMLALDQHLASMVLVLQRLLEFQKLLPN